MNNNPTVLVVEEQDTVKDTIVGAMENAGFNTLSATTPEQAVEYLADEATELDVLVTDEHMTGMEGSELAEVGQSYHPDLKVVIVSGREEIPEEALKQDNNPEWADEMVGRVADLLNGSE